MRDMTLKLEKLEKCKDKITDVAPEASGKKSRDFLMIELLVFHLSFIFPFWAYSVVSELIWRFCGEIVASLPPVE